MPAAFALLVPAWMHEMTLHGMPKVAPGTLVRSIARRTELYLERH